MDKVVSREQLKQKYIRGDIFHLIEVLKDESQVDQRLPGTVVVALRQLGELSAKLLLNKEAEIVFYSMNNGSRPSAEAVRELAAMGYRNVFEYREGKRDWIVSRLPVEQVGS